MSAKLARVEKEIRAKTIELSQPNGHTNAAKDVTINHPTNEKMKDENADQVLRKEIKIKDKQIRTLLRQLDEMHTALAIAHQRELELAGNAPEASVASPNVIPHHKSPLVKRRGTSSSDQSNDKRRFPKGEISLDLLKSFGYSSCGPLNGKSEPMGSLSWPSESQGIDDESIGLPSEIFDNRSFPESRDSMDRISSDCNTVRSSLRNTIGESSRDSIFDSASIGMSIDDRMGEIMTDRMSVDCNGPKSSLGKIRGDYKSIIGGESLSERINGDPKDSAILQYRALVTMTGSRPLQPSLVDVKRPPIFPRAATTGAPFGGKSVNNRESVRREAKAMPVQHRFPNSKTVRIPSGVPQLVTPIADSFLDKHPAPSTGTAKIPPITPIPEEAEKRIHSLERELMETKIALATSETAREAESLGLSKSN